eukprot:m.174526 g.174526  ORF g.174526 m.174526 type:complete len:224 (-) comp14592_c1_seq1:450-1121(-)
MNAVSIVRPSAEAERTTFLGALPSKNATVLPRLLASLKDDAQAEKIYQECVKQSLLVCTDRVAEVKPLTDLSAKFKQPTELVQKVLAGTLEIVRCALRVDPKIKKKRVFSEDLDYLNVPVSVKSLLTKAVYGDSGEETKQQVRQAATDATQRTQLTNFQWRVDVGISTSELKRVLKPTILVRTTLSDGSIKTFEMSTEQFHALRYNTAYALKEMVELEKRVTK